MDNVIKAVRFHEYGGSDKLALETIPRPSPRAGEVLIRVRFAGVNPVDWKYREGFLREYIPLKLPFTPGMDVSGIIEEVGADVNTFRAGQSVFGVATGSYAEFATAAATDIALIPDQMSFEQAAALPLGALTAWQAVEDAEVKPGQTVVVLGAAGGVGHFMVQFVRAKGARVVGTASPANLDYVRSLGVERSLDYTRGPLGAEIAGADAVIDTVGGDALTEAYGLLKRGGTLVTVAGRVSPDLALAHGIRALNSRRGPTEKLKMIGAMAAARTLRVEVGRTFPLAQAGEAQDLSQTRHGRGRILLQVG